MEEILVAGVVGGGVVILANKFGIFRRAVKGVIKTGYAVAAAVASQGGETVEGLKDLVAESKAEFEAERVARAEVEVQVEEAHT